MTAPASQNSSNIQHPDMVCLGVVFGAAGVRGAVRLKTFTEDIKSISKYGPVTIFGHDFPNGKKFEIEILHNVKGGVAAKLSGVNDRNMAEGLRGAELYVKRDILPNIEEDGDFYFEDLIGLMAKDVDGNLFGKVDGVFNFGAGDIIEVNLSKEKGKRMYPFSNEVVPEVNIDEGFVIIDRNAYEGHELEQESQEQEKKG